MHRALRAAAVFVSVATLVGVSFGQTAAPTRPTQPLIGGYLRHTQDIHQEFSTRLAGATALQLWKRTFTYKGKSYTYEMVGTDPAKGSVTTTVPVFLVPVAVTFSDGTVLDATKPGQISPLTAEDGFLQSPMIQPVTFSSGKVNVGTTQFTDAFQRANFWQDVSTHSPNYHVLLGTPTVLPTLSMKPSAALGNTQKTSTGITFGTIDANYIDNAALNYMRTNKQIKPNSFVVFLSYNVVIGGGVSFHSSVGPQTYTITMYSDKGVISTLFGNQFAKVATTAVTSHEIGEWLDDPFGNNAMPDGVLEVGDTLQPHTLSKVSMGNTYAMQELAFHDWFTCKAPPSTSANGWYSFLGTYKTPDASCP